MVAGRLERMGNPARKVVGGDTVVSDSEGLLYKLDFLYEAIR